MFVFSSRRRHTRWPRDWSSDVCSSDLGRQLLRVDGLRIVRLVLPRLKSTSMGWSPASITTTSKTPPKGQLSEIGRASCREGGPNGVGGGGREEETAAERGACRGNEVND